MGGTSEMELPTYGEVVKTTDEILYTAWRDLVIIIACKQLLNTEELTLKEQFHIWRPFDV
jgi:hypothetical protein